MYLESKGFSFYKRSVDPLFSRSSGERNDPPVMSTVL